MVLYPVQTSKILLIHIPSLLAQVWTSWQSPAHPVAMPQFDELLGTSLYVHSLHNRHPEPPKSETSTPKHWDQPLPALLQECGHSYFTGSPSGSTSEMEI